MNPYFFKYALMFLVCCLAVHVVVLAFTHKPINIGGIIGVAIATIWAISKEIR